MTSALQLANDIADDFGACLEHCDDRPGCWECETKFAVALELRSRLVKAGFKVFLSCVEPHRSTITVDLTEEFGEMRAEQDACTTREMGR
jgi:hypothetical protein